ncbi:MAG TPA: response regulator transcription factor [Chloroflexota bacterium]
MSGPIRIVVADDHPVVRAGLATLLKMDGDFEVIGEASDGEEAVALAAALRPDVVLMDLRMPRADGVTATQRICAAPNSPHVLVLTTYDTDADIVRAVEAGATGYLLKDAPREELFRAIRSTAEGKSLLASSVATKLMARMRAPVGEALSDREVEVLRHVARGASNKEIAGYLWISEATVKTHLIHIFGKLGVADRTAAVTTALNRGILRLEE